MGQWRAEPATSRDLCGGGGPPVNASGARGAKGTPLGEEWVGTLASVGAACVEWLEKKLRGLRRAKNGPKTAENGPKTAQNGKNGAVTKNFANGDMKPCPSAVGFRLPYVVQPSGWDRNPTLKRGLHTKRRGAWCGGLAGSRRAKNGRKMAKTARKPLNTAKTGPKPRI